MDKSNPNNHVFNATLVRQDLETRRDLWEAVVFEYRSSGLLGHPDKTCGQTTYFLLPAQAREASLMQLASRWYPDLLAWLKPEEALSLNCPLLREFPKRQVLKVVWNV